MLLTQRITSSISQTITKGCDVINGRKDTVFIGNINLLDKLWLIFTF